MKEVLTSSADKAAMTGSGSIDLGGQAVAKQPHEAATSRLTARFRTIRDRWVQGGRTRRKLLVNAAVFSLLGVAGAETTLPEKTDAHLTKSPGIVDTNYPKQPTYVEKAQQREPVGVSVAKPELAEPSLPKPERGPSVTRKTLPDSQDTQLSILERVYGVNDKNYWLEDGLITAFEEIHTSLNPDGIRPGQEYIILKEGYAQIVIDEYLILLHHQNGVYLDKHSSHPQLAEFLKIFLNRPDGLEDKEYKDLKKQTAKDIYSYLTSLKSNADK